MASGTSVVPLVSSSRSILSISRRLQQQLAGAPRGVVGPGAVAVLGDVRGAQPDLAVVDGRERVGERGPPLAQRLHLGAAERQPGLVGVADVIVVPSLAVLRDDLASRLLRHALHPAASGGPELPSSSHTDVESSQSQVRSRSVRTRSSGSGAAVEPDHQVQVAAGRVPGGADVADHLTLADVLADPDGVADRVVVAGGDVVARRRSRGRPSAGCRSRRCSTAPPPCREYGARMAVPQPAPKSVPSCSFQYFRTGWNRIPYGEVIGALTG